MSSEQATAPGPKRTPAEIATSLLDFTDAEFMAAPHVDVHEREVRLLDTDFIGVAINAQTRIAVDAQPVLPIAIAARYGGERDWDLPLPHNALLVATDLLTGQVAVVPALVPAKVLASRGGVARGRGDAPRPPPEELEGAGAQLSWTEVRERIAMPWRPGRWSFGLVYFDWLSNLVTVELLGADPAPIAAVAPPAVRPLPSPLANGLPTFRRQSRTPSAPARGVDFELEQFAQAPVRRLLMHGAFTTVARTHSLVNAMTLADGGTESPVAAIVPLTVLLVGANADHPWRLDLGVPIYGPHAQANDMVSGCFALDLLSGAPAPEPGTYACYVVMDGAIHGPKALQWPG
ncbi:MAG: hypothetical protein KF683_10320 [Rubrivivax sp.]|nr:hypothetical protein [Rubrivivax sp.]